MKVWQLLLNGDKGPIFTSTKALAMSVEVDADSLEIDEDELEIIVLEMTQTEYDELPEFGGW